MTSGFARLADKALVEVTATEEVGQPPALPTVEPQPKRKGRGAKGAAQAAPTRAAPTKAAKKARTQGAGTQGAGAKPSATP